MTTLAPISVGNTNYATVQAAFLAALKWHEKERSGYSAVVALEFLLKDLCAIRNSIAARAPVDAGEMERVA